MQIDYKAEAAAEAKASAERSAEIRKERRSIKDRNVLSNLAGGRGIRPMLHAVTKIAPQQTVRVEEMNKQMFPA
jgi:hypothetical protein